MRGIENTLDIIDLGIALARGCMGAFEDKEFSLSDLFEAGPAILALPAAIEGVTDVPAELQDLSAAEIEQIRDHVLAAVPEVGERWLVVAREAISVIRSVALIYRSLKGTAVSPTPPAH